MLDFFMSLHNLLIESFPLEYLCVFLFGSYDVTKLNEYPQASCIDFLSASDSCGLFWHDCVFFNKDSVSR